MNNDSIYTGTQAIRRAVAVLKAFGPEPSRLTAQQLSQRTGLNRSTVYRLLSALEHEGLVAAGEDGRYRLGPEIAILGTLALRQIDPRALALPLMRALAERSGETVDLEILHGDRVMIVEEIAGDHLLNASGNIGTLYPAHCTSTGKLLLAALPEQALDAILAADLCACGPRAITDPALLRADLRAGLARGYATSYEELEAHLHAVAAPIYDHQGRIVAALSISGPAARMPRRRETELARMLIEACAEVSRALGYQERATERQGDGVTSAK
ncbi:MAG TPA: IclR family transcriptional regulator [Roseiflexaceae bacterium]|nr:IclR family transcriptional regulator [Roseiflexaceae bacterium]